MAEDPLYEEEVESSSRSSRRGRSRQIPLRTRLQIGVLSPFRWLWWYIVNRDVVRLVRGLPVALVIIVVLVMVIQIRELSSDVLSDRYRLAAYEAAEADEIDTWMMWLEESANHAPNDKTLKFDLVLAYEASGNLKRAMSLASILAPDNGRGFMKAHVWIAKTLVEQSNGRFGKAQLKRIRHHLNEVLARDEFDEMANFLMGQIYQAEGTLDSAVVHYARLPSTNFRGQFLLSIAHRQLGQESEAREVMGDLSAMLAKSTLANPDDFLSRIGWARSEAFLGNWPTAVKITIDGLRRLGLDIVEEPDSVPLVDSRKLLESKFDLDENSKMLEDEAHRSLDSKDDLKVEMARFKILRVQLANYYLGWRAQLSRQKDRDFDLETELLLLAVGIAPDFVPGMLELIQTAESGEGGEEVQDRLMRLVASGRASPAAHFMLGTNAMMADDLEAAERHLRLAVKGNPRLFVALNNLAVLLYRSDPPRLEEADALATTALNLNPSHPEIRETRGQIRAKMGMVDEAISDLEFGLAGTRFPKGTLATLINLYEKIGSEEMASTYRKRLRDLELQADGGSKKNDDSDDPSREDKPEDGPDS